MKSFIIFASCFAFAFAELATADDVLPNQPAPQRAARPAPAGTHTATANKNAGQLTSRSSPNVRLNYSPPFARSQLLQRAALAQRMQRSPLAMNTQTPLRTLQTREVSDQPQQREKVSGTAGNPQKANSNRQNSNRQSFFDALKRCRHERHDCNWWRQHCRTIVFVNTGYYYLNAGYWYPAYGYDPAYDYYDYDGPIYTYGNLLPDQVIANVQRALQELGYYLGAVTGSLGPATRAALANYQRDYGLVITGAIDESTVASLGLN